MRKTLRRAAREFAAGSAVCVYCSSSVVYYLKYTEHETLFDARKQLLKLGNIQYICRGVARRRCRSAGEFELAINGHVICMLACSNNVL